MPENTRAKCKKIRMLAIDLDRTLLHTDKTVSKDSVSVLKACRETGLLLAAATARPPRSIKALTSEVPWDAAVCATGALTKVGEKTILRQGVSAQDTRRILGALQKAQPDARVSVEMDDVLYANFEVPADWNGTVRVSDGFSSLADIPCEKILVDGHSLKGEYALEALLSDDLYIVRDITGLAQIMSKNASKTKGLKALCAHYGMSMEEIASFGDDGADIDMLLACGVGVAVENAIPEAKAAAACICADNDADGVAKWIAENLLK